MANKTAAQRAAEAKAAEEQAKADAAAPAQEEQDEFAPEGADNADSSKPDDSAQEKSATAEKLAAVEAERDNLHAGIVEALGLEDEDDTTIEGLVARIAETKAAADEAANAPTVAAEPAPQPAAAAAIRVTVSEVDATGKELRKYGASIPLVSANPESVGATVKRTVQQILAISFDPAPALEQEPVEG